MLYGDELSKQLAVSSNRAGMIVWLICQDPLIGDQLRATMIRTHVPLIMSIIIPPPIVQPPNKHVLVRNTSDCFTFYRVNYLNPA
jgi:hypothetical protein